MRKGFGVLEEAPDGGLARGACLASLPKRFVCVVLPLCREDCSLGGSLRCQVVEHGLQVVSTNALCVVCRGVCIMVLTEATVVDVDGDVLLIGWIDVVWCLSLFMYS